MQDEERYSPMVPINRLQLDACWEIMRSHYGKKVNTFLNDIITHVGCHVNINGKRQELSPDMQHVISHHYTQAAAAVMTWWRVAGVAPLVMGITNSGYLIPIILPPEVIDIYCAYDYHEQRRVCFAKRRSPGLISAGCNGGNGLEGAFSCSAGGGGVDIGAFGLNGFSGSVGVMGLEGSSASSMSDTRRAFGFFDQHDGSAQAWGKLDDSILMIPKPDCEPSADGSLNSQLASCVDEMREMKLLERAYLQQEIRHANPVAYAQRPPMPAAVQNSVLSEQAPVGPTDDRIPTRLVSLMADQKSIDDRQFKEWEARKLAVSRNVQQSMSVMESDHAFLMKQALQLEKSAIFSGLENPIPLPTGVSVSHATPPTSGCHLQFIAQRYEAIVCQALGVSVDIYRSSSINENSIELQRWMLRSRVANESHMIQKLLTEVFQASYGERTFSMMVDAYMARWLSKKGAEQLVQRARMEPATLEKLLKMGQEEEYVTPEELEQLRAIRREDMTPEQYQLVLHILQRLPTDPGKIYELESDAARAVALDEMYRLLLLAVPSIRLHELFGDSRTGRKFFSNKMDHLINKASSGDVQISFPSGLGVNNAEAYTMYIQNQINIDEFMQLTRPSLGLACSALGREDKTRKRLEKMPELVYQLIVDAAAKKSVPGVKLQGGAEKGAAAPASKDQSKSSAKAEKTATDSAGKSKTKEGDTAKKSEESDGKEETKPEVETKEKKKPTKRKAEDQEAAPRKKAKAK